jgi:hypothetical protein
MAVTAERLRQDPFTRMKLSVPLPNAGASIDSSNSTPWDDVDAHKHRLAAELIHEEFDYPSGPSHTIFSSIAGHHSHLLAVQTEQ